MTNKELQSIQERIKFDGPAMAACIGIGYEQYRRYIYGHAEIPADVERKAKEIEQINITFIQDRYRPGGEFDKLIIKKYPHGIKSDLIAR